MTRSGAGRMSNEPELFSTSRVPDDDAHWDALAKRITGHAAREEYSAVSWVSRGPIGLLAASLALAAAIAFAALPTDAPAASISAGSLAAALSPFDAVGQSVVSRDRPPAIAELLLASANPASK